MIRSTLLKKQKRTKRRSNHVRRVIRGDARVASGLSVFRSCKHISAQVIDDVHWTHLGLGNDHRQGALERVVRQEQDRTSRASSVAEIAKLARDAGVEAVVFDRGASKYHRGGSRPSPTLPARVASSSERPTCP